MSPEPDHASSAPSGPGSDHFDAAASVQLSLAQVIRHARLPRLHRRVMIDAGVFVDRSVYAVLASVDGRGEVSLSDLANDMLLDISTVSRQVRRLEDEGLLERAQQPADRRISMVRTTEAGSKVAKRLSHAWQSAFADALTDWTDEELRALACSLGRLSESLRHIADR
jgi:DNA-binding MarR family transcriptional regulator